MEVFMQEIYNKLLEEGINKENILLNEPMNKHTSFKTGGNADIFVKAYSLEEIKSVLKISKENNINIFVLGNGTNILVKDEGFKGIILQIKLENVEIDDTLVSVGSGVKNGVLAKKLLDNSLAGFEFAAGIPGTIGGAIKMNAGAYSGEMKDIVEEVTYLDYDGNVHTITGTECEFSYRYSKFFNEKGVILSAKLKLEKGNKEEIAEKMAELAAQRKEKQPLEYPNAGSTFKRGENYITAKLIDECGLKGYSIGGAQVSEKHAGFIINKNNATSKDILDLIEIVKLKVYEKFGEKIELEIIILGE
jgi:UDP-N-acetylmuramate dehydrogenase